MAVTGPIAEKAQWQQFRPSFYLKRCLPRTLLGRSLLIIVSPIILMQVIITYVFFDSHWDLVIRRLSSGLAGDIAMVIDSTTGLADEEARRNIYQFAWLNMDLRVQFSPKEILPNKAPPKGSRLIDTWLRNALVERVHRPFHIDYDSNPRQVFVLVQLQFLLRKSLEIPIR